MTASQASVCVWALVPAKSFARAKSRLAAAMGAAERAELARRMLAHVLAVLRSCDEIAGVMVVTDGDDVAETARAGGAIVVRDAAQSTMGETPLPPLRAGSTMGETPLPPLRAESTMGETPIPPLRAGSTMGETPIPPLRAAPPLGAIVDAALVELRTRGAEAALVLMSDLPELAASDVRALVRSMTDRDVVAAPDLREEGTNALVLRPPDRMRSAFGTRDSFARHLRAAEAAGLRIAIHRSSGVGFDVDEPRDLARLGTARRQRRA